MLTPLRLPLNKTFLAAAIGLTAVSASAAVITKANNADALNLGSSWTGGVAPGAADEARFDTSIIGIGTNTYTLGGDVTWGQLRVDRTTATAGGTEIISGANTITLNGLSGTGILLNSGSGAGLQINSNIALGATQSWTTGGTGSTRPLTVNGGVNLGANNLTLNALNSNEITLGGLVTGTGTVTKTGPGALKLTNGNALAGVTLSSGGGSVVFDSSVSSNTFTFGGLSGGTGFALQNNAGSPAAIALTVGANNANTSFTGTLSGAGSLNKTGTGSLTLNGSNSFTGGLNVLQGKVILQGDQSQNRLAANSVVTISQGATVDYQNTNATPTGANSVDYVVNGGTLQSSAGAAHVHVRNVTLNGGTWTTGSGVGSFAGMNFQLNGNVTVGGSSASTISTATGVGLTATSQFLVADATGDSAADLLVNTALVGSAGALTKSGAGTMVLSGANTYGGGTTVTGGTLVAASAGALGTGAVVVTGGTLELANATGLAAVTLSGGKLSLAVQGLNFATLSGTPASGQVVNTSTPASMAFTSDFSGMHATGGAGALGGTTTAVYTGKIYLTAGTWSFGENFDDATQLIVNGQTLLKDGVWNTPTFGQYTAATSGWYDIDARVHNGGGGTGPAGSAWTAKGVGIKQGVQTTNASDYAAFGPTAAGAKLTISGIATASTAVNLAADSTIEAQDLLGDGVSGTNLTGVVSGSGKLTKTGAGILVLSGANTFTGAVDVSTGILRLGSATALGSAAAGTSVLSGATLDLNGQAITGEALALNGAGLGGVGALINASTTGASWGGQVNLATETSIGGTGQITLSGQVTGAGKLTKIGTGELVLSGTSSNYSGGTDIQAGTLTVTGLNSTGTGAVNIGAAGTFAINSTGTVNITGSITGAGSFEQKGGTTILTGTNAYLGSTKISGGTLQVGNGGTTGSLGLGGVQFLGTGTLAFNHSDSVVFDRSMTGVFGTLRQNGPGTLIVTGDNSAFAGDVDVIGGTLQLGAGGASATAGNLGAGRVTVDSTLVLSRSDAYVLRNNFSGSGLITQTQGTAVLNGTAQTNAQVFNAGFTGMWTVTGGTLQVGGAADGTAGATGDLGSAAVTVGSAGRLVFNNTAGATVGQAISGSGLVEVKAGVITLTNANAGFTGTIRVGQGATLQVDNGITTTGGLGTNSTVVTDGVLQFNRGGNTAVTVQTSISGSGGVTVSGIGAIFANANSYAGITDLSASTLTLTGNGTLGNGSGAVNLTNGTLVFNRASDFTVTNVIQGTIGTLIQQGSGTAILTGQNTYAGETIVAAGTLQVGDGAVWGSLGTSDVQVHAGATLKFKQSGGTFDTIISGPGNVEQAGVGTLMFRNADFSGFTGGFVVSSGTMAFGAGATLPVPLASVDINSGAKFDVSGRHVRVSSLTGSGEFALGGGSYVATGDSLFSGKITGTGAVTIAGGRSLILAGASTYTGLTSVNSNAELILADGGSLASSGVSLNGGFLVFDRSAASPAAFAVPVTSVAGVGGVIAVGAGSAALSGSVSGVDVQNAGAGTLTLTAAGTLNSVSNASGFGVTVASSTTTDITTTGFNAVGSLTVNDGTVRLNTFAVSGATRVTGGRAVVAGELQGVTTVTGGVLNIGSGLGDTTSRISAPTATVSASGKIVLNSDSSYTFANLTGDGELEASGGVNSVVTLQAQPTFTGTLTLTAGTVRVADPLDLGAPANVRFNTGTLDVAAATPVTFANTVTAVDGTLSYLNAAAPVTFTTLQGTGAIRVRGVDTANVVAPGFGGQIIGDGGVLDLRGTGFSATNFNDNIGIVNSSATAANFTVDQRQAGTISGVIGAPGADNLGLVKTGSGVLTLTAANTYSGPTMVNQGTLRIGDNTAGGSGSIGASGAATIALGAILEFDRADAITVSNAISGAGTLAQNGDGMLTLATPGGISIGAISGRGSLNLGTSLTVGSGDFAGALSGSGSVTKNSIGTLVLSGDNSAYTGTLALDSGVIQVGSGAAAGTLGSGSVINKGKLIFNRDGVATVAAAISGTGELVVDGASTGKVVFTGANAYQGKTTISKGTLQVGAGGTSGALGSGTVSVAQGASLVFNRSDKRTFQNVISGSGDVEQAGSGAVTLRGAYGLTGTTKVTGSGALTVDRASVATTYDGGFSVASGSALTFQGSSAATLTKSLAGSGSVIFAGNTGATTGFSDTVSKATVLSADSAAFTGAIRVQKGHTLKLGASSTSARPKLGAASLTVDSGAALRGSGTIAGNLISSGTVAPGFSPGLLVVGGNFSSAGLLAMEIQGGDFVAGSGDGAGVRYDQIRFDGTATLGGTLALSVSGLAKGEMVTLIKDTTPGAASSFSGAFVNVTGATVGRLITTNSEILFFNANSLGDLSGVSLHDGVGAFAGGLTPSSGISHPEFAAFRTVYTTSGGAALARELQNSSPVGLAALTAMPVAEATRDSDDIRRRAESQALSRETVYGDAGDWVTYVGATGGTLDHDDSDASSPTFDTRTFGGVVGIERRLGDEAGASVGLRLGYDRGTATLHHGGGKVDQDHARATVYGIAMMGDDAYLSAGLGMGYSTFETKRNTLTGAQKASPTGWDISGAVDAGFLWKLDRTWTLTPHAGLGFVTAKVGGFTEKGSDLALSVDGYSQNSLYTRVGTGLYREWATRNYSRDCFRFGLDISYEHELLDDSVDIPASFATFQQAGGFTSSAPASVRDRILVGPQAEWMFDEARSISAGYRAQIGFDGSVGHRFDISFEQRF